MEIWKKIGKQIRMGMQRSLLRYPAITIDAFLFALLSIILIHLDWEEQEAVQFLFSCLQLAIALSVTAGLTISAYFAAHPWKRLADLITAACTVLVFVLLFFFSGIPSYDGSYQIVSDLAGTSIGIGIVIALLQFVYVTGCAEESSVEKSLFMLQKSAAVASFYGLVLLGGMALVALAVENLLYSGMSGKVYQYLTVISGLTAFLLFVGFFPDFGTDTEQEKRRQMEKQPRFIEILFGSILIPVILALTAVLLLWTARTIFFGSSQNFSLLSGIAAAYTLIGIWLYLMVTEQNGKLPIIYRKVYPAAAGLILVAEAWALGVQVVDHGIFPEEYFFSIGWVFAAFTVILFVIKREKSYPAVILLGSILLLISIFPGVSYQEISARAQLHRLESVLQEASILENDSVLSGDGEPTDEQKIAITEAADYLSSIYDERRSVSFPVWFTEELSDSRKFEEAFGFAPQYNMGSTDIYYDRIVLDNGENVADIRSWEWEVTLVENYEKYGTTAENPAFSGKNGTYEILWQIPSGDSIPVLEIVKDDSTLYSKSLKADLERITMDYTKDEVGEYQLEPEALQIFGEFDGGEFMLQLDHIEISYNSNDKEPYIWILPDRLYIREKE
ncbi:MAG: hypothetical protein ACK5ML_10050 [Lachnospiraceae bacterium]